MTSNALKIGAGGTADSTVNGKKYAISHFNIFLHQRSDKFPVSDDLDLFDTTKKYSPRDYKMNEQVLCDKEFCQLFAGYLCDSAVTKHKEESLAMGTALQYLSDTRQPC